MKFLAEDLMAIRRSTRPRARESFFVGVCGADAVRGRSRIQ